MISVIVISSGQNSLSFTSAKTTSTSWQRLSRIYYHLVSGHRSLQSETAVCYSSILFFSYSVDVISAKHTQVHQNFH